MRRIIEEEELSGLEKLLGQKVLLMCSSYFYTGTLVGVNSDHVVLSDPKIVYETGPWNQGSYKDVQPMVTSEWCVAIRHIESYGLGK